MPKHIHEKIREKFSIPKTKHNSANDLPNHLKVSYNNINSLNWGKQVDSLNLDDIRTVILNEQLGNLKVEPDAIFNFDDNYYVKCKWYPSDSRNQFDMNAKNPVIKSVMKKIGWIDENNQPASIDYKLNNQGWRCKNFNKLDQDGIIFLGCSNTFGVGVREEDTFAKIVSEKFNKECLNLGVPGKGLDILALYVSIFLKNEIDINKISAMVIFLPPPGRVINFDYKFGRLVLDQLQNDPLITDSRYYEYKDFKDLNNNLLNDELISDFHSSNITYDTPIEKIEEFLKTDFGKKLHRRRSEILEEFVLLKENAFLREVLSINTIKSFCLEHNIPLVVQSMTDLDIAGPSTDDLARDMAHFGPATHNNIAQSIISKLRLIIK